VSVSGKNNSLARPTFPNPDIETIADILPVSTPPAAAAIAWLLKTPRQQRGPAVPEIRRLFGLDIKTACSVIREVTRRRATAA